MTKEAIILAGGMGTRLREVVSDVPKPMAQVNGRPFLAYLLDHLDEQGLEHVILAVGYKREVIMSHFGNHYRNLRLSYSIETEPLGTGGAFRQAAELVRGDRVLAMNGDTFFETSIAYLDACFDKHQCDLVMALKPMQDFDRYGTVQVDSQGRILGFEEKGYKEKGLINGGVYLMRKALLQNPLLGRKFSFEREVLEMLYEEGHFYGLAFNTYFIDIGIPQDYAQSQLDFATR